MADNGNKALKRAIEHFGSYKKIADYLGLSKTTIVHWVKGRQPVALKHAVNIEKGTNGKVTVAMLRPDIYQLFKKSEG